MKILKRVASIVTWTICMALVTIDGIYRAVMGTAAEVTYTIYDKTRESE